MPRDTCLDEPLGHETLSGEQEWTESVRERMRSHASRAKRSLRVPRCRRDSEFELAIEIKPIERFGMIVLRNTNTIDEIILLAPLGDSKIEHPHTQLLKRALNVRRRHR